MAAAKTYTKEGYEKLVNELEYLKVTRRPEIKEAIAVAKGFGDLSENAEYDEARTEQAKVEMRILELEALINNAVVVDEASIDTSVVGLGSTVVLENEKNGMRKEYSIVGSNEADPLHGKISDVCPIGQALVGKREGDVAVITTPAGTVNYKVISVTRTKG